MKTKMVERVRALALAAAAISLAGCYGASNVSESNQAGFLRGVCLELERDGFEGPYTATPQQVRVVVVSVFVAHAWMFTSIPEPQVVSVNSNADGSFSIVLPPGRYYLFTEWRDGVHQSEPFWVESGKVTNVVFKLRQESYKYKPYSLS